MELNLRKARKLESKIATYVAAMSLASAVKIRVLSSKEERSDAIATARKELFEQIEKRNALIQIRFEIRKAIGDANQAVGINTLINRREETQNLLQNVATLEAVDYQEIDDTVLSRKASVETGSSNRYDGTSFTANVATKGDLDRLSNYRTELTKELEDLEDQLAQKNLGTKITLSEEVVSLLRPVGLL